MFESQASVSSFRQTELYGSVSSEICKYAKLSLSFLIYPTLLLTLGRLFAHFAKEVPIINLWLKHLFGKATNRSDIKWKFGCRCCVCVFSVLVFTSSHLSKMHKIQAACMKVAAYPLRTRSTYMHIYTMYAYGVLRDFGLAKQLNRKPYRIMNTIINHETAIMASILSQKRCLVHMFSTKRWSKPTGRLDERNYKRAKMWLQQKQQRSLSILKFWLFYSRIIANEWDEMKIWQSCYLS